MRTTPSSRSTTSDFLRVAAVHREPEAEVRVVVEIRAGGDDPVDEPRLDERDERAMPSPAGVSAPVSVMPTVTSGSSIFCVKSWQASRRRAAL